MRTHHHRPTQTGRPWANATGPNIACHVLLIVQLRISMIIEMGCRWFQQHLKGAVRDACTIIVIIAPFIICTCSTALGPWRACNSTALGLLCATYSHVRLALLATLIRPWQLPTWVPMYLYISCFTAVQSLVPIVPV